MIAISFSSVMATRKITGKYRLTANCTRSFILLTFRGKRDAILNYALLAIFFFSVWHLFQVKRTDFKKKWINLYIFLDDCKITDYICFCCKYILYLRYNFVWNFFHSTLRYNTETESLWNFSTNIIKSTIQNIASYICRYIRYRAVKLG